jgi:hypothetical protein
MNKLTLVTDLCCLWGGGRGESTQRAGILSEVEAAGAGSGRLSHSA